MNFAIPHIHPRHFRRGYPWFVYCDACDWRSKNKKNEKKASRKAKIHNLRKHRIRR